MPWQCPGREDGAASSASGALVALLVGTAASVPVLERMEQRQRQKGARCPRAGASCPHDCGPLTLHMLCSSTPTRAP